MGITSNELNGKNRKLDVKNYLKFEEKRIHPLKDDKILTDWNGLMIAALAKGSVALWAAVLWGGSTESS